MELLVALFALLICAWILVLVDSIRRLIRWIRTRHKHRFLKLCGLCALCGAVFCGPADAWTGRRAVLLTEIEVMLALNEPYIWGKKDCSSQIQRLLDKVFPELKSQKWFHRTTTEIMATWPWDALLSLKDLFFGDLLFANSEEYAPVGKIPLNPPLGKGEVNSPLSKGGPGGMLKKRGIRADFQINHVMMQYVKPGTAVHAGKKRGFSETDLKPYWAPRITLAIRPPY